MFWNVFLVNFFREKHPNRRHQHLILTSLWEESWHKNIKNSKFFIITHSQKIIFANGQHQVKSSTAN
jgi:hypothetical protein